MSGLPPLTREQRVSYDAWQKRRRAGGTIIPDADAMAAAAQLSLPTQKALMCRPPWALTPVAQTVAWELELADMVESGGECLNDYGLAIYRGFLRLVAEGLDSFQPDRIAWVAELGRLSVSIVDEAIAKVGHCIKTAAPGAVSHHGPKT